MFFLKNKGKMMCLLTKCDSYSTIQLEPNQRCEIGEKLNEKELNYYKSLAKTGIVLICESPLPQENTQKSDSNKEVGNEKKNN